MKSMPSIDIKEDSKFSRQEKHSPSLQVIPSYKKERIQVEKSSENSYESLEFKENIKKKEQETKIEEKKDIVVRSVIEKEFIKEKEDLIPVIMPNREKKSIQNKNSSAFQIIITETRNRSKTDQINFNPKSTFMKPSNY